MAINYATIRPLDNTMAALQQQAANQARGDADSRARQQQIANDELQANQLTAQRYALAQSHGLQSGPNPRTVTDTSMTIGSGGETQASTNSRTTSGGGGTQGSRQLPPDLQGRFMPLIELGQQSLASTSTPPEVQMPKADFTPGDATAYQQAAFTRAKDQAGSMGRSAVDSLAAELAGRGIGGRSGAFGQGLANIVSQSVQPLSDLNVGHLREEYGAAQHARELAEGRSAQNYQGGIQQRGQTIGAQQALDQLRAMLAQTKYQGEINQRGQDLDQIYRMSL